MKKIKLTQEKYALVDDKDFEWLSQWKWHFATRGYATRKQHIGMDNGKQLVKVIHMHRLINQTPDGLETDHINRNKLDNRRKNLRSVNRSQNAFNQGLRSTNTSGYKGVHWNKAKEKWDACIWKDNVRINLGRYSTLQEAVKERLKAEQAYHAI